MGSNMKKDFFATKWLVFLFSLLFVASSVSAGPLPQDPNWQQGVLKNGFKYNIYPVDEKSGRVQLYLWVKSGSLNETSEQKGYAHLLEHMAFNGTKRFPGHEIRSVFERAGLAFGPDLNAYTTFDRTVYTLNVPADNQDTTDAVLLYLSDVAQNISFDEVEVRKELGVVKGEYHNSMLAEKPTLDLLFEDYIKGSEYEKHMPIGELASIDKATVSALKDYYQTWYRPDNMELLVVGNVKPDAIIKMVEKEFGTMTGTEHKPANYLPEAPHLSLEPILASSKVIKVNETALVLEQPAFNYRVAADDYSYRQHVLLKQLINYRLARANELRSERFTTAGLMEYYPLKHRRGYVVYAQHGADQYVQAAEFLSAEMARIQQHGFTKQELELQLQTFHSQLLKFDNQQAHRTSRGIVNEALAMWNLGQVYTDTATAKRLLSAFIDKIRLKQVNKLAQSDLLSGTKLVISAPQDHAVIDIAQLSGSVEKAKTNRQAKPSKALVPKLPPLLATLPQPGKITAKSSLEQYGIEQLSLSNGVEVILQQDKKAKGQVYIHYSAPGGSYSVAPQLRAAANLLVPVYQNSGLNGYSAQQLDQKFSANNTSLLSYINANQHGIELETRSGNLEFALSALHLAMDSPQADEQALTLVKQQVSNYLNNEAKSKAGQLQQQVVETLFPDNPYEGFLTQQQINRLDLQQIEQVYKQLFASANGFKLTIVGDFESKQAKALINLYVASLEKGAKHAFSIQSQTYLKDKKQLTAKANPQNRANIGVTFLYEQPEPSIEQIYASDMFSKLVTANLTDYIREELSLAYAPKAWCNYTSPGVTFASCGINLVSSTEDAEKAKQALTQSIKNLLAGLDSEAIKAQKKSLEQAMLDTFKFAKDRAWFIHRDAVLGFPVGSVLEPAKALENVDKAYMDKLAQIYLQDSGQLMLVNLPE